MPTNEFVRSFVRSAFRLDKKRSRPKDPNPFRQQVEEEDEERKVIRFDKAKEKLARGRELRGGL